MPNDWNPLDRNNFYYPDPYHPRFGPVSDRLGALIYPAEAADNITNFDQFGESL
jgi:hypothetical protein